LLIQVGELSADIGCAGLGSGPIRSGLWSAGSFPRRPSGAGHPDQGRQRNWLGAGVRIEATTTKAEAICPECATVSRRAQSRYHRRPAHAGMGNRQIEVLLTVRRFSCLELLCPRRTFVEQVEAGTKPCEIGGGVTPVASTRWTKPEWSRRGSSCSHGRREGVSTALPVRTGPHEQIGPGAVPPRLRRSKSVVTRHAHT
jgi:hypothetical protein